MDDKKRAPIDTWAELKENPARFVLGAAVVGSENAIICQEAAGGRSFVQSDTLPTDMSEDEEAILEAAGVKFLDVVENDPLFQYVELPAGWKKVPGSDPRESKLVDDKGRERASIFYKAAFYDRRANLSLSRRFRVRSDYDRAEKDGVALAHVMDGDLIIHSTEPVKLPQEKGVKYYEIRERAEKKAHTWLDAHYPDWPNPAAYWD